jgi:putative oxidoreductase
MLASIFVLQGFDAMVNPERVSPRAEPVVQPLAERVPLIPNETEQAVRINGAVQFTGGLLLGMGRLPRLSALAIAATLVPTTLAGHRFWEIDDKQERAAQRIHFLKNLSILGGLLLATVDTAGNPSLAWRAQHAVESGRRDRTRARQIAEAAGRAGFKAGFRAGTKASRRASAQSARKASTQSARKASVQSARKASTQSARKTSAQPFSGSRARA